MNERDLAFVESKYKGMHENNSKETNYFSDSETKK